MGKNCLGGVRKAALGGLWVLREDKGAMAQVPVRIHRTMRSLVLPETFIDILKQEKKGPVFYDWLQILIHARVQRAL